MDLFRRINQLQQQIEQLQADLETLRQRKAQAQDPALQQAMQQSIDSYIERIDEATEALDTLKAKLPAKRNNGHHPPESEEDLQLPLDPNVSTDTDPPSDN